MRCLCSPFFALLLIPATTFSADRSNILLATTALADDWKLQLLKYNDPDLVVDIGVGLWAWPLPMDYDDDGDYDLSVFCPDNPSNGFYFFENPTQDSSVKMPVFKPGVVIDPAKLKAGKLLNEEERPE